MASASTSGGAARHGERRGKIVLVGCNGLIGKHTVRALERDGATDCVMVCTRHPETSCCGEFASAGCRIERGGMNEPESLRSQFEGASAVYLITPGAENRAELVKNGLNVAKETRVPFVMVISVSTVASTRTIYGRQCSEIEAATKASGIPYCILRLPLYTDNWKNQFDSIRRDHKIWGPVNPDVKHSTICGYDVGEASARILRDPSSHHNKTYHLVGPSWSKKEAAEAFTTVVGRRVTYEQRTFEETEKLLRDGGMEAWQAKGLVELYHMVDEGRYEFRDAEGEFRRLTGRDATPLHTWIEWHRDEILTGERREHHHAHGAGAAGDKARMAAGASGGMPASGMMSGSGVVGSIPMTSGGGASSGGRSGPSGSGGLGGDRSGRS